MKSILLVKEFLGLVIIIIIMIIIKIIIIIIIIIIFIEGAQLTKAVFSGALMH